MAPYITLPSRLSSSFDYARAGIMKGCISNDQSSSARAAEVRPGIFTTNHKDGGVRCLELKHTSLLCILQSLHLEIHVMQSMSKHGVAV